VKRLGITFLVIVGLLMGGQTGVIAAAGITASGFLDDYDLLKPDARVFGTYVFRSGDLSPGKYTKIILQPIEIWIDPQSHYKGTSPVQMKALTDSLREVIVEALSEKFELLKIPGPDVMGIRLAITNVNARKPKKRVILNTPRGSSEVIMSIQDADAIDYSLLKAVLEAEIFDSASGRTLASFMDVRLGMEAKDEPDYTRTWAEIAKDLSSYAERFVGSLQSTFGKK
jgi:hypothetical protein